MLSLAWAGLAQAQDLSFSEPEVHISPSGDIVGVVLLPAPEAEVRAFMSDPIALSQLSDNVLEVTFTTAGACQEVHTSTKGLFKPLEVQSRRCPTATGWQERLVSSEDFEEYEVEWSLRPVEGGTEATLRLRNEVNLAVPKSVVRGRTRKSVFGMLKGLVLRLQKP